MCNIAGYVGTRPAAPILIEMIKKQEGFLGGYYTGIATLHEGKIYYAKITGDTDRLVAMTNAAKLPGNIGIIHSRSKSGGGDKWAHPFVSVDKGGEPYLAYVANGAAGMFANEESNKRNIRITEELIAEGYEFDSLDTVPDNKYTTISDGRAVHMSDMMCQLVARGCNRGASVERAMRDAFLTRPSEIVGLLLSLKKPDAITYSRFNMPMFVAFSSHGAYLSSAPLAMPEDRGEHTLLPAGSYGNVYKDGFDARDMGEVPIPIARNDARLRHDIFDIVVNKLAEGQFTMREINKAAAEAYGSGVLKTTASVTYDILTKLLSEGKLDIETRDVEGAFSELTAPKCYISLKGVK